MSIRKEDLYDLDFLDAAELESDGTSIYLSGELLSVESNVGTVTLVNTELTSRDNPVESGDYVRITGTSVDGEYTVNQVLGDNRFSVVESIGNWSGSGGIVFIYPSGASKIGYDVRGKVITTVNNVGGSLGQIDTLLSGGNVGDYLSSSGGIPGWVSEDSVRKVWKLWNGGYEGYSGCYKEVGVGIFPESIIWYTDVGKSHKIIEKIYSYNSNKTISTIVWKLYLGDVIIRTITESINYSGIFEINRTRLIS
jgi:hypothetical protein